MMQFVPGLYRFNNDVQVWRANGEIIWNDAARTSWTFKIYESRTIFLVTSIAGFFGGNNGTLPEYRQFNKVLIKDTAWWCYNSDITGAWEL